VHRINKIIGKRRRGSRQSTPHDFLARQRVVEGVEINPLAPVARTGDEARGRIPERQLRVVHRGAAPALDVVPVRGARRTVGHEELLETRVRNGRARRGRMRQHPIDVDEHAARIHAQRARGRIGLRPRGVIDLAVVRNQHAEPVVERVRQLDRVGVEFRVGAIVGPAPVLPLRNDAVRDRQQRVQAGILRIGADVHSDRGDGGRIAIRRGRRRLHVVERAAHIKEHARVPGRGEAAHANPVDLHPRARRVRVGRIRTRTADIGCDVIVQLQVAELIRRATELHRGVDAGASVLERIPPQGAGVAVVVAVVALPGLLHFGIERVETDAQPRLQRQVDVDRVALRAKIVIAHRGAGARPKMGALRRDIDNAGGIDVPVRQPAGPARKLDALGVVHILGQEPRIPVPQLADRRNAAKVDLVARPRSDRRADRALVVVLVLRADREIHRTEKVGDREVAHQVGGENRDRVGQVREFLVRARTGEGGRRRVALVGLGVDLEGAKGRPPGPRARSARSAGATRSGRRAAGRRARERERSPEAAW
jgi:hypothetical protein